MCVCVSVPVSPHAYLRGMCVFFQPFPGMQACGQQSGSSGFFLLGNVLSFSQSLFSQGEPAVGPNPMNIHTSDKELAYINQDEAN